MKNILVILFVISSLGLFGQEDIFLHFDKNFYVLGENVWFSAYLKPQSSDAKRANQLRIAVLSKEGKILKEMNLAIQEGRAAGMMTIPLDWQDGVYDFVAYTVSNTQQVNKTIVGLPIYDDFKTYKSLNVPSQVVKTNEYIKGNVTTGQPKYQRKNTITGNLDFSSNANGRLSISVVQNTPNDIAAIFGKKESIKNFKANTNFETSNTVYAKIEKTALPNL